MVSNGYSALSGRDLVASSSVREVAYKRATALGRKRKKEGKVDEDPRRSPTLPQSTSPAHEPTSPSYNPATTTAQEENDGECEFVKERTREERDEEGRANAITLEED